MLELTGILTTYSQVSDKFFSMVDLGLNLMEFPLLIGV